MPINFVFCIHNHQPVGNFGYVLENAYRESYVPFLDVFSRHPSLKLVLHYSGILYRWLEEHHPDFLERLSAQAAGGRIEFLSGGFYEPILAVIPEADRLGQIGLMRDYLFRRFGQEAAGLWLAERVWEPGLPGSIAAAGLRYVVLDDYHLRAGGIEDPEIDEPFLTSDGDRVISVIGGSERLRYLLPYEEPEAAIAFLRGLHAQDPGRPRLVTMADDGEKFGVWPGTHRRVYQEGWLERFFSLLEANREWLQVTTYAEALGRVTPERQVYLPTTSYMEMSEWTLPPRAAETYLAVTELVTSREDLGYVKHFLRGGYWRNFLSKYPESRSLLGRMWEISRRVHRLEEQAAEPGSTLPAPATRALEELWQGQCNDAYWHGVFGGLYLPFLRAALYEHLVRAESIVEGAERGSGEFLSLEVADLDGDGRGEYLLRNRRLTMAVDPASGLALELDHKPSAINLFNSLTRREESYHRRLRRLKEAETEDEVRSIHHVEQMKDGQSAPDLAFDDFPRCSLVDHLWRGDYTFVDWREGRRPEPWRGKRTYPSNGWREEEGGLVLWLSAPADPGGYPAREKRITLDRSGARVKVALVFAADASTSYHAGQEFNLTPTSIRECVLETGDGEGRWSPVPAEGGDVGAVRALRMLDTHRSLAILLETPTPLRLWLFPLSTISNSEAGYEEIPQQWSLLWWREMVRGGESRLDLSLEVREGLPRPV